MEIYQHSNLISTHEKQRLLLAIEYIEKHVLAPTGTLSDIFQRIQEVVSFIQRYGKIAPHLDYEILLSDQLTTSSEQKRIFKHYGKVVSILPSLSSYQLLNPSHSSHRILMDVYQKMITQLATYVIGNRNHAEVEISKRINKIRMACALNAQMVPSISSLLDIVGHPENGDHIFSNSAVGIYALSKASTEPIIKFTLKPQYLRREDYSISRFDPTKCEYHKIDKHETFFYKAIVDQTIVSNGVHCLESLQNVVSQILHQVGGMIDFSLPNEALHRVFETPPIDGIRYIAIFITSIQDPKKHELILFQN